MKHLAHLIRYGVVALHVVAALLLLLSAYSGYMAPGSRIPWATLGLAFPFFLLAHLAFMAYWLLFHRRYLWPSLLVLLLIAPTIHRYCPLHAQTKTLPEGSIKVLSYNVMTFQHMQKKRQQNPILTYLAQSDADIICLQEYAVAKDEQFVRSIDVKAALKAYPYQAVTYIGDHSTALACFSKLPILSKQRIDYTSSGNGSMAYTLRWDTDTLLLINNHLESYKLTSAERDGYQQMMESPRSKTLKAKATPLLKKIETASKLRAAQADSVGKFIDRAQANYIIACGDFNDSPLSYSHRVLRRRLNDAYTKTGFGPGISFHSNRLYFRIDHILASSSLETYNCVVDNSIGASDHYPIYCYVHKRGRK